MFFVSTWSNFNLYLLLSEPSTEPSTKTKVPNNPAFVFKITAPDKPKGEKSFVAIQQNHKDRSADGKHP
jgi:hypothetical protein